MKEKWAGKDMDIRKEIIKNYINKNKQERKECMKKKKQSFINF